MAMIHTNTLNPLKMSNTVVTLCTNSNQNLTLQHLILNITYATAGRHDNYSFSECYGVKIDFFLCSTQLNLCFYDSLCTCCHVFLFFVYFFLLSICLLTLDEDFLSKAVVFHCSLCFVVYVSTFPGVCFFFFFFFFSVLRNHVYLYPKEIYHYQFTEDSNSLIRTS